MRAEIRVSGIVQGVGFRPFIYRIAVKNGLVGFVRNRADALVEIIVEGERSRIEEFIKQIKGEKPPLARIHNITVNFKKAKKEFNKFNILKSSQSTEFSGSVIPPDASICNECLIEMRDPENKRFNYFFITCVNCGPRYTIIEKLPYDRPNTTMQSFKMCTFCSTEYLNPSNRRFHAQTVACPECGPKAYLTENDGEPIDTKNPIKTAGKLLEEGYIVAIKGYGGFHVATATTKSKPIARLRRVKHRAQKPFAIMARSLETVMSFAEVSPKEMELLSSYVRPIVLLRKSEDYYLSELISPGLHNVGVMLPYTGLHYILFDDVKEPAFVMTSANPPNEPIVTEDQQALKKLGKDVDYLLFHNRLIAQRCDDSVVRLHGDVISLIRRSRGYAPEPIRLEWSASKCIAGVGAELNVTGCILLKDKVFISQHIGDVENLETLQFLKSALRHLIRLTNSKVEAIACDLHPKFTTTKLAHDLSEELNCPVVAVQHHYAHIAALMAEHNLNEVIGISCDGYGYGLDSKAWGGEILYCTQGEFERLGHLQEQPMIGGDLATRYPLRMAAGILYGKTNIESWLTSNSHKFPHGEKEVKIILQQLEKNHDTETTSCGRVLDAVSAILNICHERTYEGEPAMKLESSATKGKEALNLSPIINGKVINTTMLVQEIFNQRNKLPAADLAFSAQSYIAKALAQLAVEEAIRLGVDTIGFSGGVAYNEHITLTIKKIVERNRLRFVVHRLVPPGDGGISLGQVVVASWLLDR
jgi:hydrogenase maturation protein HypF